MKALATSLLIGAAAAALQQPLQLPKDLPRPSEAKDTWSHQLHNLKDILSSLTDEARAVWDEVALMYPEDMAAARFFSTPKKHTRRPDHEWDYHVRGEEVQSIWVSNENGDKEREVDGKIGTYDLRVKKVDPSILGVDPGVKQYSGYLDDNENDKHLFYCKPRLSLARVEHACGLGLWQSILLAVDSFHYCNFDADGCSIST
jgi:cathepsin A (carboxypeptidase C)